jgi:hypothetical protein
MLWVQTLIHNIAGWFEQIKLITEEYFTEDTNTTSKLKQSLIKREVQAV